VLPRLCLFLLLPLQCQSEECYYATFPSERPVLVIKEVAGAGCCFCPLCGGAIASSGRAFRAHVAKCDGVDPEIAAQEAAKAKMEAASKRWRTCSNNGSGNSDSQAAFYTEIMHEMVGLGSLAQLSSCDMKACGHSFWKDSDTAPRNMAKLERDIGFLLSGLPLSPHGSIFMAQDRKRLQYLKALVIGPVGSPYEQGTFTRLRIQTLTIQRLSLPHIFLPSEPDCSQNALLIVHACICFSNIFPYIYARFCKK